jgi:cyclopropane-fatty-acyl-phospholipid synthase
MESTADTSNPSGSTGASPEAIQAHYDVGDDFFRLWIGPELVYSCALFETPDDDLDTAQLRKLDHHITAARAGKAARVLDVGCGWGALLRRLREHAGVGEAVGLTLSAAQAAWIRDHAPPGIEVREEDWRAHRPEAPYDAIISIGAFEHFARPGLSPQEKLATYRAFFDFCSDALIDGGRLSLQTIAFTDAGIETPAFIANDIFPESELPEIWQPLAAAQHRFELIALRNDRDHYYRSLRLWDRNLAGRRAEAVDFVGEKVVGDFQRYLKISAIAFKIGAVCLLRMSFEKRR